MKSKNCLLTSKRGLFCAIVFCANASLAFGLTRSEDGDTLNYMYPSDVVVTAPRMKAPLKEVPFAVGIVDRSTMSSLPRSVAMDEALALVPGVKVDNQANGTRVHLSIRGQGILTERGIRGIKILYDGIPVNDPTGFAPDFYDVDLNTVERIEVLKGAAASLYGGSAGGGVINILSQNAPAVPLSVDADLATGSNGFWKGFGQVGGNSTQANYRVSLSRMIGSGYRDHTHFWGNNAYGKVVYTPTQSMSITPVFGWTNVYHENPEGITMDQYREDPKQANPDAIPFNEYLQTERTTGGFHGIVLLDDNQDVQFTGYVKRMTFTEANNRTFTYRTLSTPGASVQYALTIGRPDDFMTHSLNIGTDLQWQTIDEHRVDNLLSVPGDTVRSREEIRQRGFGVFGFDKIGLGRTWTLVLSTRYDEIQNELRDDMKTPFDLSGNAGFKKVTGGVGITFSPSQDLNVFANWGQGFLPPATEELAQNPDNFGGFNTHLSTATSNSFDLGFRGNVLDQVYVDVTGFYLTTNNDFDRYRITDPLRSQETFYRTAGSSRRYGVELFTRYAPMRSIDLQLAYTYSNFKYTNTTPFSVVMDDPLVLKYVVNGNWLPNSPQHQLYFTCRVNLLHDLLADVSVEGLSKTYIDGANIESEASAGYVLVDARMTHTWQLAGLSGAVWLQARNLGDVKYVAFTEPDPGGNAYQPGAGREFFAGIKIHY